MRISVNNLVNYYKSMIKRIDNNAILTFYTYKKDRGFSVKKDNGKLLISEFGFKNQNLCVEEKDSVKIIKGITKLEFPRSHEIFVSTHNEN
jgi:hypothetical protein